MIIYPAIDMLGGRAVRLRQGKRDDVTDYGDPAALAARWRQEGASWLHLVDLDAAFDGASAHGDIIRAVVKAFGGPVELGGGIRTLADVTRCLEDYGVARCILGTAAVSHPELAAEACARHPGRIACGIDAMDGMVAVRGWVEKSALTASELALVMKARGISTIIYTDISKDGMMQGPNVAATAALIKATGMGVIGSGGVSCLDDLAALKRAGCAGAIAGKSLYTNAFTLAEALQYEKE